MIKKIWLLLVVLLTLVAYNAGMPSFAEEISDEDMLAANKAYKTGVELVKSKAYDSAIQSFEQALAYDPKMTDAYYNIAAIYISQNKIDEAYEVYMKILAINPRDYDVILQAAKISYNRKNYSLAMKYLKYIPSDYEYYYVVEQLQKDAQDMFDVQKGKIERSKVSVADKDKTVLMDNFNTPAGMVVDSEGNMFVACYSDNVIVKVDENKKRTNFVKDYLLDGPIGMAIDEYDNIYVANYDANNILKISKNGNVSIFMEKVSHPYFLYIKDDVLYVSEQGNDVVLRYNLSTTR